MSLQGGTRSCAEPHPDNVKKPYLPEVHCGKVAGHKDSHMGWRDGQPIHW